MSKVDHPQHYNSHPSGVECIDIVRHHSFNVGNVIKYLWSAGLKESEPSLDDLEKARWYLNDEIKRVMKERKEIKFKIITSSEPEPETPSLPRLDDSSEQSQDP